MDSTVDDEFDHPQDASEHTLFSPERREAVLNHDFSKLEKMDEQMKSDFETLHASLESNGEKAFNLVQDDQGQDVAVLSSENAVVWCRAHAKALKTVAEVGHFSFNGGRVYVQRSYMEHQESSGIPLYLLMTALGSVFGYVTLKSLTGRGEQLRPLREAAKARNDAREEMDRAKASGNKERIDTATRNYKEATRTFNEKWLNGPMKLYNQPVRNFFSKYPKTFSFLGGFAASAVLGYGLQVLWENYIDKDYVVQIEIYNFTSKSWKIDAYYGWNEKIAGDDPWKAVTITSPSNTVTLPAGVIKAGRYTEVESAEYNFANGFTAGAGLGVALRVRQPNDEWKGFATGYQCNHWSDNCLALKSEVPPSMKDFYEDKGNWTKGTNVVSCDVAGDSSIHNVGATNALGGRKDNLYKFIVIIGKK